MKRSIARSLATLTTAGWLVATALACGDGSEHASERGDPFAWPASTDTTAVLHVRELGEIEIALYPQLAPETVANFVRLADEGFYDGTSFHRVIPGFMVQGGDPNSRDRDPTNDGLGGPGYQIDDEMNDAPHTRGSLSMANLGRPNSGGSQFFIVHQDAPHLDGKHAVFGRVSAGMEVVDAITEVETDVHGRWGNKNRPIENVVVEKVEIRRAESAAAKTAGPEKAAGEARGARGAEEEVEEAADRDEDAPRSPTRA